MANELNKQTLVGLLGNRAGTKLFNWLDPCCTTFCEDVATCNLANTRGFVATVEYGGEGSFQSFAGDLILSPGAGTSGVGDTSFLAGMMGNILGANLTDTHNYIAGVIGAYNITGTNASTYQKAGVLGLIGDGTITADGAFIAIIDGDSAITVANAAFGVASNNSVPGSGFQYGLDLYGPAHDGYNALSLLTAEIRLSSQLEIYTGSAATRAAVRAQVTDVAPVGSVYVGTGAVGTTKPNFYIKVLNAAADTDWERVVTAATD